MAALYKMFSCQGILNWIYGECTVNNVLLSRWFDLVRHGYGTIMTLPLYIIVNYLHYNACDNNISAVFDY